MARSNRKCPLCQTRKAKRFCPAKGFHICPVCCGTKREVEIDCTPDCVYLHSGREYERHRRAKHGTEAPLTERLWSRSFQSRNLQTLTGLWYTIDQVRTEIPALVDADVREVLDRLVKTYRTLATGIYYDHAPDTLNQKILYGSLKSFLEQLQNPEDLSAPVPKTGDLLDCLLLNVEMAATTAPSRPKSRVFLDRLGEMVATAKQEASRPDSQPRIVLP